jgi:hypothetical protein
MKAAMREGCFAQWKVFILGAEKPGAILHSYIFFQAEGFVRPLLRAWFLRNLPAGHLLLHPSTLTIPSMRVSFGRALCVSQKSLIALTISSSPRADDRLGIISRFLEFLLGAFERVRTLADGLPSSARPGFLFRGLRLVFIPGVFML